MNTPNNSSNLEQAHPNDSITATKFKPSTAHSRRFNFGPIHLAIALFVAVACFLFWFLFTSKSVQLQFSPAASNVEISGGFAFELGGVYLLREGEYEVSATADLHEPLVRQIEVGHERNQSLELVFHPLPGFIDLELIPHDGQLSIDGERVAVSELIEVGAGERKIEVTHSRYLTHSEIIEVQGKQITQSVSIALAPNWANVSLNSDPIGAQVWLDDQPTPLTTPAVIEALAGEREISLRLPGYKTHRQRIFAQAGVSMELPAVTLVQADATLDITSQPNAAGVTINGQFVGTTPLQLDLKSGTPARVTVLSNGYESFTRTLTLQRGEQTSLRATLVRQLGKVVITTQPNGANLSIDGKKADSANTTLMLPIKEHKIDINLEGYAGYKQNIVPKVGITQEIKVKLLTLAEARLKALKPTITTSSGQNLKLFQPFAFTMGASRREPGRRANETLRQVDMSKLFYLATQEVTNAQFREFASGHDSGDFEEVSLNEDDMPVTSVSWHEAAAYCNWLSVNDGLDPFYNIEFGKVIGQLSQSTGYRLPTEAEWAWAARTLEQPSDRGTNGRQVKQLRFPWGANLPPPDRHGNYADRAASSLVGRVIFGYNDNYTAAAPVGTYKPNIRGLFDLGGNVAEWTHDFYDIPDATEKNDPMGPATGEYRVIKGSSWMHGTITELRYSFRDYGIEGRQDLGFRIARNAE